VAADPKAATPVTTSGLLGESAVVTAPGFAVFLLVWFAVSYAVTTLFASRYGSAPTYAVAALAVAVALTLAELHREGRAEWLLAALGVLFVALLIRDYAMFPGSPVTGTPGVRPTVPEAGFSAKLGWAVAAGAFALGTALTFLAAEPWPEPTRANVRAFVLTQWKRGPAHRFWWVLIAVLLLGILVFGALVFAAPDRFNSLAVRIGRYLLLLPPALLGLLFVTPRVFNLLARRPQLRLMPIALTGLVFGAYFAFGFLPELSRHLSPARGLRDLQHPARRRRAAGRVSSGRARGGLLHGRRGAAPARRGRHRELPERRGRGPRLDGLPGRAAGGREPPVPAPERRAPVRGRRPQRAHPAGHQPSHRGAGQPEPAGHVGAACAPA
jgi:hypothetical protein